MAIPHRLSEAVEVTPTRAKRSDAIVESGPSLSGDAEELAVRAIARFNVERRQAGEAPLDVKGIERFRSILAEAIERYEASTKTAPDDAH